ncbi:MAG: leucine-rich repeat protein [Oscillospiraceae bacterium]|nr:leucine-rich repeat protein [Oscillospiraceae bacterium]
MKKLLSVFLSVLLVVQLVVPVWAAEPAAETDLSAPETAVETAADEAPEGTLPATDVDPGALSDAARLLTDGKLEGSLTRKPLYAAAKDNGYYTDVAEAILYLRERMVGRSQYNDIPLRVSKTDVPGEAEMEALILGMLALATAHTGVGNEGDYLLWQLKTVEYSAEYTEKDGYYYLDIRYYFGYYTSYISEESYVSQQVKAIIDGFGFTTSTDDYTKILSIYSFVCDTVSYDYDHLEDESYTAHFTAFAALRDGKAVCLGYAALMYRLLLEAGIDCRIIAGYDAETGVEHAWNIVRLGDVYYNLDSTWDAGYADYAYFLKNQASFADHIREDSFNTQDFHTLYPMAQQNYTLTFPVISSGSCGANVQYTLYATGELEITGTGATTEWADANSTPWKAYPSYLRFVWVDEGVTGLGAYAFTEIPYMLVVSLPESLQSVGVSAFQSCSRLEGVFITDLAAWCGIDFGNLDANPLLNKATIYLDEQPVTELVIPDGVAEIKPYAFAGANLSSVTFADPTVDIGAYAFAYSPMKSITLPEGMTSLGESAFAYSALESVTLPSTLSVIPAYAFIETKLQSLVLPEGVAEVGKEAFYLCAALAEITVPSTLKKAGSVAFYRYSRNGQIVRKVYISDLAAWCKIDIEGGGSPIGNEAYLYLNGEKITDLVIPEGIEVLKTGAFAHCCNEMTVTLPQSLTRIEAEAFSGLKCKTLYIPENVTYIGRRAFYGADLEQVTLAGVEHLDEGAFNTCFNLKTVDFGDKLREVGGYAFNNGALEVAVFPATLEKLGSRVLFGCHELASITFEGDAPAFEYYSFNDINTTAYYPADNPTWTEEVRQQYGGKITWVALCSGPHTFENGVCTACGYPDPDYVAPPADVTRIFGADRYETAFKTAEVLKQQLGVEKFNNIVVACGDNFADALGGSYLAAKKNAPILLVKSSKIDAVKSYIKANLNPGGTVYLLGGTAAIPAAMDTGLDGFNVKRLAGATRYDTNLLILEEAGVTNEDILICTGKSFADSLSAAAAGRPLLLVKDSLNDSQKAFLQSHAANKKYILGGTAAVSTSVENQAKAYGTVKRIGGNTRYETSVLIAKEFFPDATQAALAYAQNFPDGLSGGALAYAMKAPLVLTASGKEAAAAAYAKEQGITSGVILGGSGLISDKAVRTIFQMQSDDVIKIG